MTDIQKTIEKMIGKNRTISTMESCTSGLIASMITDTEGASAIFPGGYVTYSNKEKIRLGVPAEVITEYGVYSSECALAMARVAQQAFQTEIAIGITGTTGNVDPNNGDSVQGQAYYCIVMGEMAHDFEITTDVTGLTRKEIKRLYADLVFQSLEALIAL